MPGDYDPTYSNCYPCMKKDDPPVMPFGGFDGSMPFGGFDGFMGFDGHHFHHFHHHFHHHFFHFPGGFGGTPFGY